MHRCTSEASPQTDKVSGVKYQVSGVKCQEIRNKNLEDFVDYTPNQLSFPDGFERSII